MPERKFEGLICGLTILVLILDLSLPRGWSIPLLYFPSVLLTYRLPAGRAPIWVAGVCSLLVVLGALLGGPGSSWQMLFINRATAVLLFWTTALFIIRIKQVEVEDARLRMEIEHQRSELQTILDAVPAIVFYKDTQHRIILVNEAHARSLGLPKDQIHGRTDEELGSPYAAHYRQADQYVISSGVPIRGLVEPLHTQTGTHWLQTDKIPIRDLHGKVIGLVGVAMDITRFKETEDKLRESEASLALAQRMASLGSWTLELQGADDLNPLHWSDQVFRIFGYEPGQIEVTNENFFNAVHPDDRPRIRAALAACIRNGDHYQIDHRIYLPDGTERIVHEESDVMYDAETGRPLRLNGTIQDITERKWTERLLAEQRSILERIAGGIPLAEVLTSLVRLYEDQFPGLLCSVLLLDSDQRLRIGVAPSLPDAYNQAVDGVAIGPAVGSCGTAAFRREIVIVEEIATNPLWEGFQNLAELHELRSCWSIPIFGPQGEVLGTFAMYSRQPQHPTPREISLIEAASHLAGIAIQRKRSDAALKESEERYRTLVENAPTGVFVSMDDRFTYVNEALCRLLGASSKLQLLDKPVFQRIHPDQNAAVRERIERLLESWEIVPLTDQRYLRMDGSVVEVQTLSAPLVMQGRRAALVMVNDVTERKHMERTLKQTSERLQALSRQLLRAQEAERAHIARELHDEIGQVLTAIGFHLHSLINVCGPEHRPQLEEDVALVDRAIQQIRDLSLDLRPPTLDLLGLESTLRAYLQDQARRTGLKVHLSGHLESRLSPELEIICYRVVQTTLTNVVRHARATDVWVELQHLEQDLELMIRDNGVGFDTATVWQEARQGRSFGLVGVRERVELIGGRLTVESTVGSGTTIHASFPLSTDNATIAQEEEAR